MTTGVVSDTTGGEDVKQARDKYQIKTQVSDYNTEMLCQKNVSRQYLAKVPKSGYL